MAIPVSELQSLNPSSIIELYKLELNNLLHGKNEEFLFHSGSNQLNQSIIWQGVSYDKFPVVAEGFEFTGQGTLPRPTLTISNLFGFVSGLIIDTNKVTSNNDLAGAKLTRRRVLASSLDNANFTDGVNIFGTPNSNELPQEIYFIDRKSNENREVVTWELSAVFDLMGIRAPKRQCTRSRFPAVGTFKQ